MSKPNNNLSALKFRGEQAQFGSTSAQRAVNVLAEEIQAKRMKPAVRYENTLAGKPTTAPPKDDDPENEKGGHVLQLALPAYYKLEDKVHQPVHVIWRDIKRRYVLNTAAGVVGLLQQFEQAVHADFKSLSHLFARRKALKDKVNRNSREALQTGVISSNLLMFEVLGMLPNQLWGQAIDFTPTEVMLGRVEAKLCAIFGRMSKGEIMALDGGWPVNHVQAGHVKPKRSALGKRKATAPSGPDMHYTLGYMKCHYCAGVHTDIYKIGPHKKADCLKLKQDQALDIYSVGKPGPRKTVHEPVPKMKGETKKIRREVPIQKCLQAAVPVDACRAVQEKAPPSPNGYVSPPPSALELPVTPGRGTAPFDDEDVPMDSVVNAGDDKIQGGPEQSDGDEAKEEKAVEVNNQGIVATTERFAGMMSELESKVRSLYPFLLDGESYLTTDSWVLESGCGHGLTSEMTQFVRKKPNTQYMFTFAQGSKHSNTHIGTIKMYLRGPKGIRPFLFDNKAMVPHATSNILSDFWLRRSGYEIIGSLSGKFKFVLFDNELVFIAKAINEAYYVQNKKLLERQILCSAVKTQSCKSLELPESVRLENTLQEWHAKLGHINKDTLIDMLSIKMVGGLPTMAASGLRKIPSFCSTCAEMKERRMSYRNTKSSRGEQPISTIHMDTNGPMKTMGVYGSQGTIKYLLNIIDDNTKKEVFEKVEELLLQLEREGKFTIRRIRSDGGTEFVNAAFKNFCKGKGINGAAERDHQSKLDRVRCALKDADMAHKWWPEALMYMSYVQNRTIMRRLGYKTPYETMNGKPPNVKELPVWGSVCFEHIPAALRKDKKLSARAVKCRFLGISEDTKGYRLWDIYNNKHLMSRDMLFDTTNVAAMVKRSFGQTEEALTTESAAPEPPAAE
ncbi:hypothetical protein PHPALM_30767 [Phytophthora palmivora]|uniref:Retroviral polymerase SH3-like domain-containing protein n=1 Tax=Phytophthora palmivora TaxID=4796 RepID=A0A2P4X4C1_9STRA|nr:hypothetical protein PHPALM_30767 [Phytophthora palmivora]